MPQKGLIIDFPNELVLMLSAYLSAEDFYSLCLVSRLFLSLFLFHLRAIIPRSCDVKAALFWAVLTKNRPFAKYLLEKRKNITVVTAAWTTQMHMIPRCSRIYYRSPASGKQYIGFGTRPNLDSIMNRGTDLLLYGKVKSIGCEVFNESGPGFGYSPLDYAVKTRHYKLLSLVLRSKDHKSSSYIGYALMVTIQHGSLKTADIILTHTKTTFGEQVFKSVIDEAVPIAAASCSCQKNPVKWLRYLLRHGARVNAKKGQGDKSALQLAVVHRKLEAVKILLANGADIECKDGCGQTPLQTAVEVKDLEMVRLILGHGADVHSQDHYGHSALHLATGYFLSPGPTGLRGITKGDDLIVECLLEYGADINARDMHRRTALHLAVRAHEMYYSNSGWRGSEAASLQASMAELLKDKGADMEAVDILGGKPLDDPLWQIRDFP